MEDHKSKKPIYLLPDSIRKHYAKYRNKAPLQTFNVLGTIFEIDSNYEILDSIGKGSYGIVVAAKDKSASAEQSLVAIKKIQKAFEHKLFTKRTLRELKILRLLKHYNVASILKLLLPKSREEFEDLYVVYELMETDLKTLIKSPQILSEEHIQFFLYQMLRGLKYIHSASILHRDLVNFNSNLTLHLADDPKKPGNLLVNTNCDLKICDFGLARAFFQSDKKVKGLTDYVITRWYRAPEMLLQWKRFSPYSFAVDIWSVGCIFAEMLKRKPILNGTDTAEQMKLIVDFLGTPSEEDIEKIPCQKTQKYIRSLPKKVGKKLETYFPDASPIALDLLRKLLQFNPDKRITVEQALKHPYLEHLHCEEDEETTTPVSPIDFEFEEVNLTLEQLKDMIYEEILLYHFEDFHKEYDLKKAKGQSVIKHIIDNENSKYIDDDSDDDDDDDDFNGEDDDEDLDY